MEDGNYSRRYFSSCYMKLDYEYLGFACLKKKFFFEFSTYNLRQKP